MTGNETEVTTVGLDDAPVSRLRGERYSLRIARCAFYPALLGVLAWGAGWTVLLDLNGGNASGGGPGLAWLHKGVLEAASLWTLGAALLVALIRWAATRRTDLLWLTAVVGVFFCREVHFAGTSEAVYLGTAILFGVALWRPAWTEALLATRRGATLFMVAFACYLFAVSLDGRWWFDWSDRWKDAAVLSEEVMEMTGHLMILALTVAAPRLASARAVAVDTTDLACTD